MARFFVGLELVDPGLVQVHQWRPDPGGSAPEGTVSARAAVERAAEAYLGRMLRRLGVEPRPVVMTSNIYCAGAVSRLPRKLLFYDFNDSPFQFARTPRWAAEYWRRTLASVDVFFVVSKFYRRELARETSLPLVMIGNGVELSHFEAPRPVPAERDIRLTRGASRPRRDHEPRARLRRHGRRQQPPQAPGQAAAVPDGGQDHGPCGQDRISLRPDTIRQLPVQARGQATGQQPVPGPQPPDGQAAKIVVEQDMHHLALPRSDL